MITPLLYRRASWPPRRSESESAWPEMLSPEIRGLRAESWERRVGGDWELRDAAREMWPELGPDCLSVCLLWLAVCRFVWSVSSRQWMAVTSFWTQNLSQTGNTTTGDYSHYSGNRQARTIALYLQSVTQRFILKTNNDVIASQCIHKIVKLSSTNSDWWQELST